MQIKKFHFNQFSNADVVHPIIEDKNMSDLDNVIINDNQLDLIHDSNESLDDQEQIAEVKPLHLIITEQEFESKLVQAKAEGFQKAEQEFQNEMVIYKQNINLMKENIELNIRQLINKTDEYKISLPKEVMEIIKIIIQKICEHEIHTEKYFDNIIQKVMGLINDIASLDIEVNPQNKDLIKELIGKLNYSSLDINIIENFALDKFDIVLHHNDGIISSKYQERLQEIHNLIDNMFITL